MPAFLLTPYMLPIRFFLCGPGSLALCLSFTIDFTGTAGQTPGPCNAGRSGGIAAATASAGLPHPGIVLSLAGYFGLLWLTWRLRDSAWFCAIG